GSPYLRIKRIAWSRSAVSPSRNVHSNDSPGASSNRACHAAHGSFAPAASPFNVPVETNADGAAKSSYRPTNDSRSHEQNFWHRLPSSIDSDENATCSL